MLDFRRSPVVLLATIANQIGTSGSLTFQKRHGLSSGEWRLFANIAARPHISGVEIAQAVGMDKAAVSRLTRGLADRGLIQIGRKQTGRNQQALVLTAAGARLHAEAIQTAFERERCLLSGLSEEERSALVHLLVRLVDRVPELFALAERPLGSAGQARADAPGEAVDAALERAVRLERSLADLLAESAALRAELADRAGAG